MLAAHTDLATRASNGNASNNNRYPASENTPCTLVCCCRPLQAALPNSMPLHHPSQQQQHSSAKQKPVLDLYGIGLAEATAAADHELQKSVKPETLRVRHSAFSELSQLMQSKQAACNRSIHQATPEDMLVHFTQHWLPTHASSVTADGESYQLQAAWPAQSLICPVTWCSWAAVVTGTQPARPATPCRTEPNQKHAERPSTNMQLSWTTKRKVHRH